MPHTAMLPGVEVPVTHSPSEAVGLMQQEGIVGAGGAGFPTYKKYESPPRTILVNACDSEPGYYADKLLLRDEPEALVGALGFLDAVFSIDTAIVCAEEVARPYMRELEGLANDLETFSIAYIEPKYKYGQERALCKAVLGMEIPPKHIPPDHGIVVNNNETMFNVYKAIFLDQPVTTKFLQVYGEARPLQVYEAPIGTLACDLLEIHGTDPASLADHLLYDGGPILADRVGDPMGEQPMAPVRKTTNAFLVVHPDKDRPRNAHYPDPSYEHNTIDAPWAPTEIRNIEDRIDRVRVPLSTKFSQPGPLHVEQGDSVERGEVLAEPGLEGLSVSVHASIPGTVTRVTEDWIEIER